VSLFFKDLLPNILKPARLCSFMIGSSGDHDFVASQVTDNAFLLIHLLPIVQASLAAQSMARVRGPRSGNANWRIISHAGREAG
jgi:hypothetical protein